MIRTKETGVYYKILKNKDKMFYITYKDMSGKKIWLKVGSFDNGIRVNACKKKRGDILIQLQNGETQNIIINKRIKKLELVLDEVAIAYHEEKKMEMAPKNIKASISKYNTYLKPLFGDKSIQDITASSVKKMMIDLSEKLAGGTINGIRTKLSSIINFAINNDELNYNGKNVVSSVKRIKVEQNRDRYLQLDEVKDLLEKVNDNKFIYTFCKLALSTGARLETLLNIRKGDIDFKSKNITFYDFKNKRNYYSSIKTDFIDELKDFIKDKNINDLIFERVLNHSPTRYIQKFLKPILDELFNEGLPKKGTNKRVVIHTLRHTFASHLVINGTSIYKVMKLLNHKSIEMTMRYAHLNKSSQQEDIDKLGF